MKSDLDALRRQLASELSGHMLSCESERLASYRIDGKQGALLCLPENEQQISTILRLCAQAEAAVVPWGGGIATALGNPPRQIDVVIDTRQLNRIVDYDPANLTVRVQCGLPLDRLQISLSEQRQFVPFDPPFPERSTIGGIIAASLNGPRRNYYGSVRDLVIGVKVVLSGGEQIKAGGKVVKNVAGYDMCKLFVGSLGTLGIITEATLRLAPVPEAAATVIVSGTFAQARQFCDELNRSHLLPSAVLLFNETVAECWAVAVHCEGFDQVVARIQRDLIACSKETEMTPRALAGAEHRAFWQRMQNAPLEGNRLIFRVTVPRAEVFDFVQALGNRHDCAIISDLSSGTIWLSCPAIKPTVQEFAALAMMARARRGHVIIFAAPSELKPGIEVWGESPQTISLMHDLKQRFDPKGLLNPGRFLAGI